MKGLNYMIYLFKILVNKYLLSAYLCQAPF
jgi:hypothetical protein